jgi:hypothetical protein
VAVLLGAGLAEILKTMATYVSSRMQLPLVAMGFTVGGTAVVAVQLAWTAFTHGHIDLTVWVIEFGIILLFVAQRFALRS